MASVKSYWATMRGIQNKIALRMGVALPSVPKEARVASVSALAISAVIVKALIDKGVLTEADLQAALSSGEGDPWDDEPALP